MEARYKVASKGSYSAYLAVYLDGDQISVGLADEILAEEGKDILYNSGTENLISGKKDEIKE